MGGEHLERLNSPASPDRGIAGIGHGERQAGVERTAFQKMLQLRARGEFAHASQIAERVRHNPDTVTASRMAGSSDQVCLGHLQLAVTDLLVGNTAQALAELRTAAALASGAEPFGWVRRNVVGKLALVSALRGSLMDASGALEEALGMSEPEFPARRFTSFNEYVAARFLALETGREVPLEPRIARPQTGEDSVVDTDADELWCVAMLVDARVALVQSRPAFALELVNAARARHPSEPGSLAADLLGALSAEAFLLMGNVHGAKESVAATTGPYSQVARTRALLYEGETAAVIREARRLSSSSAISLAHRGELLLLELWAGHLAGAPVDPPAAIAAAHLATHSHKRRLFTTVPEAVVEAIAEVLPDDERHMFNDAVDGLTFLTPPTLRASLTPRESDVLAALARYHTINATATALYVSPNTVKTQVASIYRKLGVKDRQQAITVASKLGLLAPSNR